MLPSGMLPSGMLPSGMLPSGMLPSGMLPFGTLPSATEAVKLRWRCIRRPLQKRRLSGESRNPRNLNLQGQQVDSSLRATPDVAEAHLRQSTEHIPPYSVSLCQLAGIQTPGRRRGFRLSPERRGGGEAGMAEGEPEWRRGSRNDGGEAGMAEGKPEWRRGSRNGGGEAGMAEGEPEWRRGSRNGGGEAGMAEGKPEWRRGSRNGGGDACDADRIWVFPE